MPSLRADAQRSRERIVSAARDLGGQPLRMNEVARVAGVGVGTVYRHFPSTHALVEELARDSLERLADDLDRAAQESDPADALATALERALRLLLDEGGLQAVLLSSNDEAPEVRHLKDRLVERFHALLTAAQASGAVRADLTVAQIEHLVCGIEHAVRLGSPQDLQPMLAIMLAGLRTPDA